jgi:hypothetical protein
VCVKTRRKRKEREEGTCDGFCRCAVIETNQRQGGEKSRNGNNDGARTTQLHPLLYEFICLIVVQVVSSVVINFPPLHRITVSASLRHTEDFPLRLITNNPLTVQFDSAGIHFPLPLCRGREASMQHCGTCAGICVRKHVRLCACIFFLSLFVGVFRVR